MTLNSHGQPIVLVYGAKTPESRLAGPLESAADRPVRAIEAARLTDALESVDGAASSEESGNGDSSASAAADPDADGGLRHPSAVVLETDDRSELRTLLERVRNATDVPTIAAPSAGREPLAATAVRADADEYAPADRDDAVERILEAVADGTNRDGPVGERDYHQILANELPDEAFVIGEDGTYLDAQIRPDTADLYTVSSNDLIGRTLEDAFPGDVVDKLREGMDRAFETDEIQSVEYGVETTDGWRRFEARVVPIDERIEGRRAVVWLARDITERAKREQELRSQQARLERLNRINAIVRDAIETLVQAPTRDAIERQVCEQLVDSELYCGALIVERAADDTLSYRIGAGDATTYMERSREVDADEHCSVTRAAETGETQITDHILETEPLPPELQDAAREDDVRATIAVPITYEDATYGVLSVLASRTDAFTDSEAAAFELLGETIGFTIMAVKNRQLLLADTVVELEFRIDGGDTFSFDLSEAYDCTCSLEWVGTSSRGKTFQFVTVDGLDGETVLEEARAHDSIEECRLIHDGTSQCTIEMRLAESGVRTLANHGVTIRDVAVSDGVGTCLVEVPQDANVREIADALSVIYENTELVARREIDRPVRTAAERRNRILDELTERQLTTLRVAYYAGFFDWPRESTGEEIAEAMDVTPPTMHQHLRKGMKTILNEFFEEGDWTPEEL